MGRIFGTVAALGLALSLSLSDARADGHGGAIEGVIQSQIDAFLIDDFESAFSHASPMIKNMFRNPDNFGTMVRQGYPMVWRPADLDFLELRTERGAPVQRVMIRDAKGAIHILDYEMLETPEGWQINGVRFVRTDLGA